MLAQYLHYLSIEPMRHLWTILLPLLAPPMIVGCAASLDPDPESLVETQPPTTLPPTAAGTLRLTSFGGWTGTATSENFQLNRMELTPYNMSGSSDFFSLLSTATLSPIVAGEE